MEDTESRESYRERRPKISICIATYNHDSYIADCLASVLSQQVDADMEILVGDDCSKDETRRIVSIFVERYPTLVIPVFHEKNVGGSQNYHLMICKSSGDYICHLDGDDYWMPGKLARQLEFLERNENCSASYTNAIVVDDAGQLKARFNGDVPQQFDLNFLVRGGNFLNSSSLMYRKRYKDAILQLQGETLDYHKSILLAKQGAIGYINRSLSVYRINSSTSMVANRFESVMELYWSAIVFAWNLGAEKSALRYCIFGYYRSLLRTAVIRRKPGAVIVQYRRMAPECELATKWLLALSIISLPYYLARDFVRKLARGVFKGGAEILFDR